MSESILGVIVGGLIAAIGSATALLIQFKTDKFKNNIEQRKCAYINAVKWFSRVGTSDMEFLGDTYAVYEEARIGIFLYGSKKIKMLFEIANKNQSSDHDRENFKKQVLREIGYE